MLVVDLRVFGFLRSNRLVIVCRFVLAVCAGGRNAAPADDVGSAASGAVDYNGVAERHSTARVRRAKRFHDGHHFDDSRPIDDQGDDDVRRDAERDADCQPMRCIER